MLIPVRCFSCGKVLGNKEETLKKMLLDGMRYEDALDKLWIKRYCCRTHLITYIDSIQTISKYPSTYPKI